MVFAGGVHDARSAAMVGTLSAPLAAARGRVGVLIGTAYLFTEEVVAGHAIGSVFQREALDCARTVLFETAPGHAIRCSDTPYFNTFRQLKRRLVAEGCTGDALKETLESLNLGRLRLASKGILRETDALGSARYVEVPPGQQRLDGMYMLGQVAALRREVLSIRDLHRQVSVAGTALLDEVEPSGPAAIPNPPPPCDVAIVGMGCVLPGATDARAFWSNILNKVDAITEVPPERFDADRFFDRDVKARDRIVSKWGGFLDDVPFDPLKWGIPPAALASIDAFQLLALEVVDQALKDAGLDDRPFPRERTSVIMGASGGLGDLGLRYGVRAMLPSFVDDVPEHVLEQLPEWTEDSFAGILLNVAAGRVANRFDFGGVNYTVDAACASSLAAVQLGIAELERGTSDVVVVGGIDTVQTPFGYMCFSKSQALSPSGKCRTFDQNADGIAISEGVVALVIKRLADAERDGDRIYAVVKAVAGSSDGRGKGLTAPRPEGQMRALRRAYAQAGFPPSTVGLIEAHGTGTVAGDGAEVMALDEVFRAAGAAPESCAIGSVKSMIGHTKASAGVAGLMKATLALHHRVLPPTLNVETPNTRLREDGSPFFVNVEPIPWAADGTPRRAGVSAFGFGGTDFHAVLEEYSGSFLDDREPGCDRWPAELFVWGAPDASALAEAVAPLRLALAEPTPPSLHSLAAAVCGAAAAASGMRLAIVATSADDLRAKLTAANDVLATGRETLIDPRGVYMGSGAPVGRVAFMFPGQGSQSPGMLRDLAVHFAEVRDALSTFDRALEGRLPGRLSAYIYPPSAFTDEERKARARALTDTRIAQPALGAVEAGLLNVLAGCSVRPDMVAGHSYGECMALHAAGVIDAATLAVLSERRGDAIANAVGDHPGSMAAAAADPAAVRSAIGQPEGVWLANFNAPKQTIIAGVTAAVDEAVSALTRAGISARSLPVACAFHTPLMHGARVKLDEALAAVQFAPPQMPVYSNTLAACYPDHPEQIARALSEHLEHPVRFVDEIRAMYDAGARIFVEVGPRAVLTGLIRQIVPDAVAVALDHGEEPGIVRFLHSLGQLAASGVPVSTARLFVGRAAEALDKDLRPIVRRAMPAWVVNGAGARPASAPAASQPRAWLDVRRAATSTHDEPKSTDLAVYPPREARVVPSPAGPLTMDERLPSVASAPVLAGVDAVMQRYQQVMSQFLNTQSAIMAAYLGAADPDQALPPFAALPASSAIAAPPLTAAAPVRQPQAAPAPPTSVPIADQSAPAAVDFAARLVQVAAECTGYSPDMLGLDLGLEADLGIDSIKRVEILSLVRRQCSEADQQRLHSAMDALTRGKTFREMATTMTAAVSAPVGVGVSASAPTPTSAPGPHVNLAGELLRVVSECTGYPIEMLEPDLGIESDLGIDSIKRVEILTTFRQRRTADEQAALQNVMDQLTGLKTLAELSRTIEHALSSGTAAAVSAPLVVRPSTAAPVAEQAIPRMAFLVIDAPPPVRVPSARGATGVTLVTDDGTGVAGEVCVRLRASGDRPVLLRQRGGGGVDLADGVCSADWTDAAAIAHAITRIREAGPIAALVHVAPLAGATPIDRMSLVEWRRRVHTDLRQLHVLVQAAAADLRAAGRGSGATILAATALGGDFGETGQIDQPTHGGVVGYLRTAAIEFPEVRVRVVDFESGEAAARAAHRIVAELDAEGPLEIGYCGTRRITLIARPAPLVSTGTLPIGADSVVLLTGGARGITAEIATEMARRFRPTLVLAGLSALVTDAEPSSTAALEGPALKAAIAAAFRANQLAPRRPVDVESAYQRLVRQREIRATLAACEAAGSRVEYHQLDVRDEAALRALLDRVYASLGRLDVVVHGAGVIEDKLIEDKSVESFDRVVHTKVDSVFTLVQGLRHETLRALVLMSSVTAAFGNRGQADYGAANGVYNAMAQLLAPPSAGRVVAVNWGPWDKVGMVSEEARRQFLARGIAPIDPALGVRALLDELAGGPSAKAVVVLGGGPWADAALTERQLEILA